MLPNAEALLNLADLTLRFGRVNRATFHPDGERPESDTDHTVMLAVLACTIAHADHGLNLRTDLLAELAIVHDLVEAEAGDTNTFGGLTPDDQRDKEAREAAALVKLRERFGWQSWLVQAIDLYERQDTPEARFLRYLDKITPKLTHTLNGCVAVRRAGKDLAWVQAHHRRQGAELAARYPEWVFVLGPLFDAACEAAERALVKATG